MAAEKTGFQSLPQILTVEDIAYYLRIHRSTVYRLIKKRALPAWKIGADWRSDKKSIDAWMFAQSNAGLSTSK